MPMVLRACVIGIGYYRIRDAYCAAIEQRANSEQTRKKKRIKFMEMVSIQRTLVKLFTCPIESLTEDRLWVQWSYFRKAY